MKAIFIAYSQAFNEEIVEVLEKYDQRGFSRWADVQGRGSVDGEPHLNSHAWPRLNQAVLVMVDDEKVQPLLDELKKKDEESPKLGLRAFVWNIETSY